MPGKPRTSSAISSATISLRGHFETRHQRVSLRRRTMVAGLGLTASGVAVHLSHIMSFIGQRHPTLSTTSPGSSSTPKSRRSSHRLLATQPRRWVGEF